MAIRVEIAVCAVTRVLLVSSSGANPRMVVSIQTVYTYCLLWPQTNRIFSRENTTAYCIITCRRKQLFRRTVCVNNILFNLGVLCTVVSNDIICIRYNAHRTHNFVNPLHKRRHLFILICI